MVIMITMIMSIMIMTDNDDDDDDDHVHPMILNIRFCRLPIVLHKIFCVYSVYILCFLVGCEREFLHPRQLRTKTESAPPQHSTVSPHSDGHDHHNDHDDMVTITMMIMMPGPDDNLLDDIVPFVHFPHPDAFDKNHNVTQY